YYPFGIEVGGFEFAFQAVGVVLQLQYATAHQHECEKRAHACEVYHNCEVHKQGGYTYYKPCKNGRERRCFVLVVNFGKYGWQQPVAAHTHPYTWLAELEHQQYACGS